MTAGKKIVLFLHRWLGIITGLVVFVVSITGCIFCFQDEIQDAMYAYRRVKLQNEPYLAPSVLKRNALKEHPGAAVSYIYYYGKGRPAAVLAATKKDGLLYIFENPYTGVITHTENTETNFFTVVEYIHLYLLLPPKAGSLIVGTSVLIFVIIMITGIILWWPKRKSDCKRSFAIKWNGRWRRVNYDLHNVLGFYVTGVAIILAITGLAIAFNWMNEGIYTAANLGRRYPAEKAEPRSDSLLRSKTAMVRVMDKAFAAARAMSPRAEMFLIYDDPSVSGAIGVTAYAQSLHYYKSDGYNFDKYSGKLSKALSHNQKSPGMKLNNMNYDVHVGQILGLTGKVIAFLASLICASLPVTGLIIWLGKRKKSKQAKPKAVAHRRHHQITVKPHEQ